MVDCVCVSKQPWQKEKIKYTYVSMCCWCFGMVVVLAPLCFSRENEYMIFLMVLNRWRENLQLKYVIALVSLAVLRNFYAKWFDIILTFYFRIYYVDRKCLFYMFILVLYIICIHYIFYTALLLVYLSIILEYFFWILYKHKEGRLRYDDKVISILTNPSYHIWLTNLIRSSSLLYIYFLSACKSHGSCNNNILTNCRLYKKEFSHILATLCTFTCLYFAGYFATSFNPFRHIFSRKLSCSTTSYVYETTA